LKITPGGQVLGRLKASLNIGKFINAATPEFVLTDGNAHLFLENEGDGSVVSYGPCDISGVLTFKAQGIGSLDALVDIKNATLSSEQGKPKLHGQWSVTFKTNPEPVLASNLKVWALEPGKIKDYDGHADLRAYSITLNVRLEQAASAPSDFTVLGNAVTASANFPTKVAVEMLPGQGEYKNRDNPDEGGRPGAGPEEIRHSQEFGQDTFHATDLVSDTVRIYLLPTTYHLAGTLSVDINLTRTHDAHGLTVTLSDLSTSDQIQFKEDSDQFIKAFADGLLSVAHILHVTDAGSIDDLLRDKVNKSVSGNLSSLNQTWTILIP
jgi:hypothetical protein